MQTSLARFIFLAGLGQLTILIASALVPFRLRWRHELRGPRSNRPNDMRSRARVVVCLSTDQCRAAARLLQFPALQYRQRPFTSSTGRPFRRTPRSSAHFGCIQTSL